MQKLNVFYCLMKKYLASMVAFIFLIAGCKQPQDDDLTPVIISSYNEGNFSIRIFELKTDSTFRYWRNLGKIYNTHGYWVRKADTFFLYNNDLDSVFYGKIFLFQEGNNTKPYFELSKTNYSLQDMTIHNSRISLRYINPPKNLDFQVPRKKANKN